MLNQLAVTSDRSHACSGQMIQTNQFLRLSRPSSTNTAQCFSFLVSRPLKILRNLQGKMGHAWSLGLTGISALLPNLPYIRGIYGQLVDFGHCSPSFWPQGPALNSALNRFLCNFVLRLKDCNRDRCQGRFGAGRHDPLGQLNKYINMQKEETR